MGRTADAVQQVLDCMRVKQSVLLEGPPGCNKSGSLAPGGEVHTRRAAELGIDPSELQYIDYRPALEDPTESKGIPFPDKESGTTVWLLPEWLPKGGFGILNIEEIGNAGKAHHIAVYQITQERCLGKTYKLPEGWDVVATSNRKEDGCGVNRLPGALMNRFHRVPWLPDAKDYAVHAREHGVNRMVIAAINWMPDMINNYDGAITGPQSTGRSITAFANILSGSGCTVSASGERGESLTNPNDMRIYRMAAGSIGEIDAARMISFLSIFTRLPDINAILNGKDVDVPGDQQLDVAFAAMSKLAEVCDRTNVGNVLKWIDRLPNPLRAVFASDLVTMGSVAKSDTFLSWLSVNAKLFT